MITQRKSRTNLKKPSKWLKRSFHRLNEETEEVTGKQTEELTKKIMALQLSSNQTPETPRNSSVSKRVEFIFALYEQEAKETKTFVNKINGVLRKARENPVAREIRRAEKLKRQISVTFCPNEVLPLMVEEINEFKEELRVFIKSVGDANNDIMTVARDSRNFRRRWNQYVAEADGKFLQGYGIIEERDLTMPTIDVLATTMEKVKSCKNVPKEIQYFKKDWFLNAVSKCEESYSTLRTFQREKTLRNSCKPSDSN